MAHSSTYQASPLHQSDSFTYISSDGVSDSEPATVSISIDSDGIVVTTEEDSDSNDGLCSLREAIQAANTDTVIDTCMAGAGSDRILFGLSSATYPLSLSGVNEEVNGSGDLDILASVTIIGCGHANTVVDGLSADRVIDVQSEGVVRIENLSIYGGLISEGFGGGIRAQSTLELAGVNFEANHAIGMTGSDGSSVGGGGGGGGAAGLGGAIYSFDAYVTIEPGNEGCALRTISQVAETAETDVVTVAHLLATAAPGADISVAKAAMRQLVAQAATQVAAVAEVATTPVVLEASVASAAEEVAVVPQRQAEMVAMAVRLPLAAVMVVLAVAVPQEAAAAARLLVARFSRTVAHLRLMHVRLPTTWPAAALRTKPLRWTIGRDRR